MKKIIAIFALLVVFKSFGFNPSTPIPPDSLAQDCDTLWLKSGKIMIVSILSDNGSEIKFTDCPPSEIVSTIPKSSTKLSPRDSILAAQRASLCDTIYMKGGEVIAGHMKFYNSRKVVYTGCCEECVTEKELKRKDVDSIVYVDGRVVGSNSTSTVTTQNTEPVIDPNQNTQEEEDNYSPQEKEGFKKKMKLFGILGLCMLGIAVAAAVIVVAVSTVPPIAFGAVFFVAIVAGMFMAMGYIRNKKKAGLSRKKKRN